MSVFEDRAARASRRRHTLQAWGSPLIGLGLGAALGRTTPALLVSLVALALGITALVWAYRMEVR